MKPPTHADLLNNAVEEEFLPELSRVHQLALAIGPLESIKINKIDCLSGNMVFKFCDGSEWETSLAPDEGMEGLLYNETGELRLNHLRD